MEKTPELINIIPTTPSPSENDQEIKREYIVKNRIFDYLHSPINFKIADSTYEILPSLKVQTDAFDMILSRLNIYIEEQLDYLRYYIPRFTRGEKKGKPRVQSISLPYLELSQFPYLSRPSFQPITSILDSSSVSLDISPVHSDSFDNDAEDNISNFIIRGNLSKYLHRPSKVTISGADNVLTEVIPRFLITATAMIECIARLNQFIANQLNLLKFYIPRIGRGIHAGQMKQMTITQLYMSESKFPNLIHPTSKMMKSAFSE
jgi:hypothetical protein